jgi:hypothetical protein
VLVDGDVDVAVAACATERAGNWVHLALLL